MPDIMAMQVDTVTWQGGDTSKPDPLFILILNNPTLRRPAGYQADLSGSAATAPERAAFARSAGYIVQNLLGQLPGQTEKLLGDAPDVGKIKIVSMYVTGLAQSDASWLVEEDDEEKSDLLIPRRDTVAAFLAILGVDPDIVYIVSGSQTHNRATAYGTTDDDTRGGVAFVHDGQRRMHRYFHKIPGMAAMHTTSSSMTAAHEFGHAFSSYTNGFITDLYVDGNAQFNRKVGTPIPDAFAAYNGVRFASDKLRDGLGYPADWRSYHSELADPARPALMDNFWLDGANGMASRHDKLTKAFILDRIAAKIGR